jgi:hypothetical protein
VFADVYYMQALRQSVELGYCFIAHATLEYMSGWSEAAVAAPPVALCRASVTSVIVAQHAAMRCLCSRVHTLHMQATRCWSRMHVRRHTETAVTLQQQQQQQRLTAGGAALLSDHQSQQQQRPVESSTNRSSSSSSLIWAVLVHLST